MAAMSYDIWLANYISEQKARAEKARATQHPDDSAPHSPACGRKRSCDSIIVVDDDDLLVKRPNSSRTARSPHGTASASPPCVPMVLLTLPSRTAGAPSSQPTHSAFSAPASSSVSRPTFALGGNQQHPVNGHCYVTLPTIPPVRILVPEDSPLAQQFAVSNDIKNLMRLRRDSLYRRQLTAETETKPAVFEEPTSQILRRPQPVIPIMGKSISPPAISVPSQLRLPVVPNGVPPVMHLPAGPVSFTGTMPSSAIDDHLYGYLLHELAKSLAPHAEMPRQMNMTPLSNSQTLGLALDATKLNIPVDASKTDGISFASTTMPTGNANAAPTCPQLMQSMLQHHPQNSLSGRQRSLVL